MAPATYVAEDDFIWHQWEGGWDGRFVEGKLGRGTFVM